MSDPRDDLPVTNDDEREVVLDDEAELDGPPPTVDAEERIELRAELLRETEFDAFEQGIQG